MNNYPELKLIEDIPEFEPKESSKKIKRKRRFIILKIFFVFLVITALIGTLFSYKVLSVSQEIFVRIDDKKTGFFDQIKKLVVSENREIKGQSEGRTNFLLLGMGGEGHTGAMLTDTIMIASIKFEKDKNPEVAFISIPRDLYIPLEGKRYHKINSIYSLGEQQGENQGGKLITKKVEEITGLPIHYFLRVDFEGFRKVIDSLGGVEVYVERGFKDTEYPTYDFGYQTVIFHQGLQSLNGEEALQFSRSRHGVVIEGEGYEGSDFARAKRQQKVIEAVKEKAFSIGTITNPKKVNDLMSTLGDHARTNVEPWELMAMIEIAKSVNKENTINKVIDNSENGLLYSTSQGGAYVLLPKAKDFSEIKSFAETIFEQKNIEEEKAVIYVLNGTTNEGFARNIALRLKEEGYHIGGFGNALENDYEKTLLFTDGKVYQKTLESIQKKFKARIDISTKDFSKLTKTEIPEGIDFILVLGEDYRELLEEIKENDITLDQS